MTLPYQDLRQSAASLFAFALLELFPDAQLMSSELNQLGFTYAFYVEQPLQEDILGLFEDKMRSLVKQALPIESIEMMRENASGFFLHRGQKGKARLVGQSSYNIVPILKIGESFYDYGHPPYVETTKELAFFKLQKLEKVEGKDNLYVLTGTVFPDPKQLRKFLKVYEEAKKRDHRLLGRELELYGQAAQAAGGWFWLPKGAFLRELLLGWWRAENVSRGFLPVSTPRLVSPSLMRGSTRASVGFQKNRQVDEELIPAPSLEPLHALLFSMEDHVEAQLPVKFSECAELPGKHCAPEHGLFQPALATVDRSHAFCSPGQVLKELIYSLQFIEKTVNILGFEYHWSLILRRSKYAGTIEDWNSVLGWMEEALQACNCEYVKESSEGGYDGPRMVMRMKDALGREWDGPFIGVDFNHPKRLGLHYHGADGRMHTPYMITQSTFGSLERFIAVLVEHYGGAFPLWLAPEQVRLLPISSAQHGYADGICKTMAEAGIRCRVDYRQEPLGTKIHAVEREKTPYALVLGDAEEKNGVVNVRSCNEHGQTKRMKLAEFLQKIQEEATVPGPQFCGIKKSYSEE